MVNDRACFGPVRYDPSEEKEECLNRYFSARIVLGSYISISFAARLHRLG